MNKYVLAVTRHVHGIATALHLSALKGVIKAGERKVATAMRNTDCASVVKHAATAAWKDAQTAERFVRKELKHLRDAAVAEADTLSGSHTVGA